jgi:hypothetical protein
VTKSRQSSAGDESDLKEVEVTVTRRAVVATPAILAVLVAAFAGARWLWLHAALLEPHSTSDAWYAVAGIGACAAALSSIAVAAIAFRGLRSLRLTRKDMNDRAERESKLTAIHRLEELANTIIPMNTPILTAMQEHSIGVFLKAGERPVFDPDPKDVLPAATWARGLPDGQYVNILGFLNRLEAWCVYFTTGVADDTVAFGPVAPLLRAWVGQYYPVLLVERSAGRSGNFPNVIMLYKVWSARMEQEQLDRLHADLTQQLKRQRSKSSQLTLPKIIGKDSEEV